MTEVLRIFEGHFAKLWAIPSRYYVIWSLAASVAIFQLKS